jgi:hypothetical protein
MDEPLIINDDESKQKPGLFHANNKIFLFKLLLGLGVIVLSVIFSQLFNLGKPVYQVLLLGDSLIENSEWGYHLSSYIISNLTDDMSPYDLRVAAYGQGGACIQDIENRLNQQMFPHPGSFPPWRILPYPDTLVKT